MTEGLWGDEFVLPEKPKARKILDKIEKPKRSSENTAEKVAKSKKISFAEKVSIIEENVKKVLGKQVDNVLTIRDRSSFHNYLRNHNIKNPDKYEEIANSVVRLQEIKGKYSQKSNTDAKNITK